MEPHGKSFYSLYCGDLACSLRGIRWEQIFGSTDSICKAITVMNEFYHENPLKKSDKPYSQSPMSMNLDDLDMTRSGFSGDTPRSDQGLHSQNDGHPANGDNQSQSPAVNGASKEDASADGSSDKQLKEAANDPATHRDDGRSNGLSDVINSTETSHSPKRKAEDAEVPDAKRSKTDEEARAKDEDLESGEEGELEE